jgi:glycosyltransferase involved in cell wall biosynthesis
MQNDPAAQPRVAFVVNSPPGGVLGPRVDAFAQGIRSEFRTKVLWRKTGRGRAIFSFLAELRRFRPDILYLVDLGYSATLASLAFHMSASCAMVIETGDPLAELLWAGGRVGQIGRFWIRRYERAVLRRANRVVVRGSGLKEYLLRLGVTEANTLPDGVDTELFRPLEVGHLRRDLRLNDRLVIGVLGSLNWSRRLQWGYGSELVDVLATLQELPVHGLVVGDGPGRTMLEREAARRGVTERITFVGHIRHSLLPPYINAMDICLSTQTNDCVGRSRTTAKLPLFMACGRFVLASRVGEAAHVLPDEMLLEYQEGFDPDYPGRLAERIEQLVRTPAILRLGGDNRQIAESEFGYNHLLPRLVLLLREVLTHRSQP